MPVSSFHIPRIWASPELVDQIVAVGKSRWPNEACGIVVPSVPPRIVELPNSSLEPRNSYIIDSAHIATAIHDFLLLEPNAHQYERGHFMVWHTHPNGQVGPSDLDMRTRIEGFRYLVVSIPQPTTPHGEDGEVTASEF